MAIEKMTQESALLEVRSRARRAIESNNLSIVFGSNGESGVKATGNYSLLAKATGMARVHIMRVLKGRGQPSYLTLRKLNEVTGISLDEISGFILSGSQDQTEKVA